MNGHEPPTPQPQTPTLRRRNSIATSVVVPTKFSVDTSSLPPLHKHDLVPSPLDISLLSLKSSLSYTSLKDLIPSTAVNSPTAAATPTTPSAYEISIRNHLVKQAAWAYLQPMSSSADSSSTHFFHRLWVQFWVKNPITACFRFISHVFPRITGVFDRIFQAIRIHFNKYEQ